MIPLVVGHFLISDVVLGVLEGLSIVGGLAIGDVAAGRGVAIHGGFRGDGLPLNRGVEYPIPK